MQRFVTLQKEAEFTVGIHEQGMKRRDYSARSSRQEPIRKLYSTTDRFRRNRVAFVRGMGPVKEPEGKMRQVFMSIAVLESANFPSFNPPLSSATLRWTPFSRPASLYLLGPSGGSLTGRCCWILQPLTSQLLQLAAASRPDPDP